MKRNSALKSNYEIFIQFSESDKNSAYEQFAHDLLNSYWIDHAIECEQSKDLNALTEHLLVTYIESDEDYAYEQLIEIVLENKRGK